jgi:hypothetical protein
MHTAALLSVLAVTLVSCQGGGLKVTHRTRDGQPDQWVRRVNKDEFRILVDTNGDGRPDVIKTVKDHQTVEIESDRDFNGQVDLVQEYSDGVLVREVRDDDFDGRPETVKTFRPDGTLAIIERDPSEKGAITVIEYYDKDGHLTRRDVRK